jgi:hypothetical protein
MKITIETNSYNSRRYGRPWIAVVDFSTSPKGEYRWGEWVGNHNSGSAGLLVIEAAEGDIVATGQKDFRRPADSAPVYYQVREGKLVELSGKAEAYKLATSSN